jgi:hypothetical protein
MMRGMNPTPVMNRATDASFRSTRRTTVTAALASSGSLMSVAASAIVEQQQQQQQSSPKSPKSVEGSPSSDVVSDLRLSAYRDVLDEGREKSNANRGSYRESVRLDSIGSYGLRINSFDLTETVPSVVQLPGSSVPSRGSYQVVGSDVGDSGTSSNPLGSYQVVGNDIGDSALGSYQVVGNDIGDSATSNNALGSYHVAEAFPTSVPSLSSALSKTNLLENSDEESSDLPPIGETKSKEMDLNELYQASLERLAKVQEGEKKKKEV